MRVRAASLFVLLAAGCAQGGPPRRFHAAALQGMEGRPSLFVSPAGEPFRGRPAPIAAWFGQADADGDGALSFAEFQADFRRWFAALDGDHDGEIAPAEVARYETEILPEMAALGRGGGMRRGRGRWGAMGRPRGGRGDMGGGAMAGGAARFGLLAIPHPIMSADEDLNRGISQAEFDRAAASRFNLLDEAHDGRLTLAELTARRRAPPQARR
jgi:Ca2+-binding EF-hand superfamily protein